jgi:hypothetical protein
MGFLGISDNTWNTVLGFASDTGVLAPVVFVGETLGNRYVGHTSWTTALKRGADTVVEGMFGPAGEDGFNWIAHEVHSQLDAAPTATGSSSKGSGTYGSGTWIGGGTSLFGKTWPFLQGGPGGTGSGFLYQPPNVKPAVATAYTALAQLLNDAFQTTGRRITKAPTLKPLATVAHPTDGSGATTSASNSANASLTNNAQLLEEYERAVSAAVENSGAATVDLAAGVAELVGVVNEQTSAMTGDVDAQMISLIADSRRQCQSLLNTAHKTNSTVVADIARLQTDLAAVGSAE